MQQHYYINNAGTKDGPIDLVTVMRRIRAGKIGPDTLLYSGDKETPVPAREIKEIALFFSQKPSAAATLKTALGDGAPHQLSLTDAIGEGWRFTMQHSIMTVFAGGIVLLSILLASGLVAAMGSIPGGMLSWIVFIILHYIFMVFSLRFSRGQTLSMEFMNKQFATIVPYLLFAAIVQALMMAGGFMLLVIPGIAIAVYYIFVPFLILDQNYKLVEAMHASRLLLLKDKKRYQATVALLVLMHLACLMLIIPIPVTMPVFAGALARIYEDISSS